MAKVDLENIIASAVEAAGYRMWWMEYIPGTHQGLLRVYIDSPEGIGIEDCERASRQISSVLDVYQPIEDEYHLEVSSPGLDRPLFTFDQYQEYIGKKAKFVLQRAIENKRRFKAIIKEVDVANKKITVTAENNHELILSDADIAKVNLVFEFEGGKKHGK